MRYGWFQMRREDEVAVQVLPSVVWRHVASLLDLAGQAALAATCRWDYRMIKSRDRSRVLTILFVVAENWWTLLYLYGDAAFYCCVSRSRSLEKITSECFFAEILTKWTSLQSLVHNLVHYQASEASCGDGSPFGGAGSRRKVWRSNSMLHNKSNLRDDTSEATFSQTKFEEMR